VCACVPCRVRWCVLTGPRGSDTAVGWMVPGAKCQAQGKDGQWLDAVILAHQLAEVPPSHHLT